MLLKIKKHVNACLSAILNNHRPAFGALHGKVRRTLAHGESYGRLASFFSPTVATPGIASATIVGPAESFYSGGRAEWASFFSLSFG
jgi:hypothetical protein